MLYYIQGTGGLNISVHIKGVRYQGAKQEAGIDRYHLTFCIRDIEVSSSSANVFIIRVRYPSWPISMQDIFLLS